MIIKNKKLFKVLIFSFLILLVFINLMALIHSYKFSHFSKQDNTRTRSPEELSVFSKIAVLFTGISNPKPRCKTLPPDKFPEVNLTNKDNLNLHCWLIPTTREHKGTALLFHGYASEKSSLLPVAKAFHRLGFDTMAMDFPGHGESDGFKTTIGFHEAADVLAAFNYARLSPKNKHKKIILYGFSIGAVAIMRAIHLYRINPDCIILECPFGSLLQAL
ncbi:MAG: alpha/beta hydrolase, partial [bacterium]|nr:alpha/beta hydrolase [bacterium]